MWGVSYPGITSLATALGRKNYLFAGSDSGGDRAAAIYTIIRTAKLNELDPEAYLRDTIASIAEGHPINRVAELRKTHNEAPLMKEDSHNVYPKLTGCRGRLICQGNNLCECLLYRQRAIRRAFCQCLPARNRPLWWKTFFLLMVSP